VRESEEVGGQRSGPFCFGALTPALISQQKTDYLSFTHTHTHSLSLSLSHKPSFSFSQVFHTFFPLSSLLSSIPLSFSFFHIYTHIFSLSFEHIQHTNTLSLSLLCSHTHLCMLCALDLTHTRIRAHIKAHRFWISVLPVHQVSLNRERQVNERADLFMTKKFMRESLFVTKIDFHSTKSVFFSQINLCVVIDSGRKAYFYLPNPCRQNEIKC
jgi:hypothetical protein